MRRCGFSLEDKAAIRVAFQVASVQQLFKPLFVTSYTRLYCADVLFA